MPASCPDERARVAINTMNRILRKTLLLLASLLAAAALQPAAAQAPCKVPSADCVEVGDLELSVSLGYGTRTNPVVGRDDIPLFVVPHISYYGQRFFLESLEPGVTLYESDAHTFNLIASPGFDRVFFSRSDLQNVVVPLASVAPTTENLEGSVTKQDVAFAVGRRRTTYLAGPEWMFRHDDFIGQVTALYEVTGRHKGYEVRAAVSAPLVQRRQSLVVNTGVTWKSAESVNYYYGVPGLYRPDGALSPFIKFNYALPLTDHWTFTAFVHYEYLDGSIVDSPIVSDREVVTAFAGLNFKVL
jgi:outer membrane protein